MAIAVGDRVMVFNDPPGAYARLYVGSFGRVTEVRYALVIELDEGEMVGLYRSEVTQLPSVKEDA